MAKTKRLPPYVYVSAPKMQRRAPTKWPAVQPPAPGFIILQATTLVNSLQILLGDGSPSITQGYSTWEEIDRPKRKNAVEWTGEVPFKLEIPCLFDGWIAGRSVESLCNALEGIAVSRVKKGEPPSEIKISGPVPHADRSWHIDTIDWGDALYNGGVRVRQAFSLNLIEKVDMPITIRERTTTTKPTRFRTITTKQGENLRDIAERNLGNPQLWKQLRTIKNVGFRSYVVPKGTKVRVPVL